MNEVAEQHAREQFAALKVDRLTVLSVAMGNALKVDRLTAKVLNKAPAVVHNRVAFHTIKMLAALVTAVAVDVIATKAERAGLEISDSQLEETVLSLGIEHVAVALTYALLDRFEELMLGMRIPGSKKGGHDE
jgi:hypothetical protein